MTDGPHRSDSASPDQVPTVSANALHTDAGAEYEVGRRIGPYRLIGLLGEGGFGIVYLAEQTEPVHRRVALKIIKPGMDTRAVIARFEAERQALALMNHPNVARVFDAGSTEQRRPYFVMEHVSGLPITRHCDQHKLSIDERLRLFIEACEAVQHAHQKGVIHRDIKPTNILVAMQDDRPVPKVIDFGVAKATAQRLTEKTLYTAQGQLIGTPEYMSPEQVELSAEDVDTRTDIYSLGVLLYELLTGTLPFDRDSLHRVGLAEIQRIIREFEPPKPSTKLSTLGSEPAARATGPSELIAAEVAGRRRVDLRTLTRMLRGDLDWITMKALEKDRRRRYATAAALAADVARHLGHEPVTAGPPGAGYRIRKFVRRNRVFVTAATAVFVVLLAATTGTSIALRETVKARASEADQRREAERQAAIAQAVNDFLNNDLLAAAAPGERGLDVTVREVLDAASKRVEGQFEGQPLVEAAIRLTLADTYWRLGHYDAGVQHAERACELRRAQLGVKHPDTLDSMNSLALLYKYLGRHDEAETLYRETLEIRSRVLGDENPVTLSSINNLAVLLWSRGELQAAEALHRQALGVRRRVLGLEHADTLMSMANLAALLWEKGELDEAERLAREALQTRQRVLPQDHPDTLQSVYTLAAILAKRGARTEAEELYRQALQTARRVLGAEHPRVAMILNDLAFVLQDGGEYVAAEKILREVLAIRRKLLGEDHWRTGRARSDLGECLTKLGRYEDAEQELLAAHSILADALGERHRRTVKVMSRLAALYDVWEDRQRAALWRARAGAPGTSTQRAEEEE